MIDIKKLIVSHHLQYLETYTVLMFKKDDLYFQCHKQCYFLEIRTYNLTICYGTGTKSLYSDWLLYKLYPNLLLCQVLKYLDYYLNLNEDDLKILVEEDVLSNI